MEPYTIEDIELLRQKSGLSYQEAVALLDYHNGSVARALIDLEKHGRLKTEESTEKEGTKQLNQKNQETKKNETRTKALNILQKLYRSRVKIRKGETTILNVSVLIAILSLFLALPMTIVGIIASIILGYQFSFTGMDPDFASDSLEKMVRNAAQNAKSSVSSVVQTIAAEEKKKEKTVQEPKKDQSTAKEPVKGPEKEPEKVQDLKIEVDSKQENDAPAKKEDLFADAAQNLRDQTRELEETMDSFFESNPAATGFQSAYSAAASSVPTLQVPFQAETRDGDISTEDDQDGYSTVTIG